MNDSDGSQATTEAGSQSSQMADVSAPVPQPTSSQLAEGCGCSHSTNNRARGRLQRPMYASYASPVTHLSPGAFLTSTPYSPPNAGAQPRGPLCAGSRFPIGSAARVGCTGLLDGGRKRT